MRHHPLTILLLRWAINALGIVLASSVGVGISYRDGKALLIVVVVLGLFNAFLKPLLVFFTLPFVVLTLGLGVLFINALLLLWAAALVDGFHVDGFLSAFLGALIIGVLNLFLGRLAGDPVVPARRRRRSHRPDDHGDIIDI